MRTVHYGAGPLGYTVQVAECGEVVKAYSAGNHRLDSQQGAAVGSRWAVPVDELRGMAKQTADDMAEEYGAHFVCWDDGLADNWAA